jgi:predicted lysophospholipase L1 biosynthesis ABC-type transport system permease subunit
VPYDYWTVVVDSAVVTQQITIVALFLLVFFYTYSQLLSLPVLSAVELALLVFGYLVRLGTETPSRPRARSSLATPTGRLARPLPSAWGTSLPAVVAALTAV